MSVVRKCKLGARQWCRGKLAARLVGSEWDRAPRLRLLLGGERCSRALGAWWVLMDYGASAAGPGAASHGIRGGVSPQGASEWTRNVCIGTAGVGR